MYEIILQVTRVTQHNIFSLIKEKHVEHSREWMFKKKKREGGERGPVWFEFGENCCIQMPNQGANYCCFSPQSLSFIFTLYICVNMGLF